MIYKWHFRFEKYKWGLCLFWVRYYENGLILVPFFWSIHYGQLSHSFDKGFVFVLGYPQILKTELAMIQGIHIEITNSQFQSFKNKLKKALHLDR